MKPYYHDHESAYKEIKSKGQVGWGNAKTLADLGDDVTKQYLKDIVSEFFPVAADKKALDVGCGSGTTAFMLAQMGLRVTGIDISETAIQMGEELASQQNLEIKFVVGDVLELEKLNQKFDLIYDSHCLHCIVFEEDRRKVLAGARNSLSSSGIFVLDTMVVPEEKNSAFIKSFGETLRFDENYILWHKSRSSPSSRYGVVEFEGQNWCAQRRVYPWQKVMDEIAAVGLEVVAKRLDAQEKEPSMLRLVLKAKS